MPSPLAHGAVALALWPLLRNRMRHGAPWQQVTLGGMLMLGVLGPDLDIVAGLILTGEAFATHGGAWHSLFAGALFGVLFALICNRLTTLGWGMTWLIGSAAWWSHVVLDAFTHGRGVAMFWPFMNERVSFPVTLFYGVRHSEPLALNHHVVTVVTELPFVLLMWFVGVWVSKWVVKREASLRCTSVAIEGQR